MSIYTEDGSRISDMPGIIHVFTDYYKKLLGATRSTAPPDPAVISNGPIITPNQSNELSCHVTREEIKQAVFSMAEGKAPGPDGFSIIFFKKAWHIISEDLFLAIEEFFCSVYKIITKIIASRIQRVLGHLINDAQSAFVKGRLISSNILMAHELAKHYGRKNNSPRAILHIDLRKAFDTINWDFIRVVNCKADMDSISRLNRCLQDFSQVSGLEANPNKCSIFLSGVNDSLREQICNYLNFSMGELPIRYLGMPLIAKRLTYLDCSPLISKISGRFQFWQQRRSLSYAGRIQLIK
ncbi:uncharacterized protein LOC109842067 [Asparagus officinalis]|uniref:uncharacterized protein LOC109842067 n=1 Tax=Asparagus officinalis TaxID=4686 RepID=UPI00098E042A|nr:uncharacterized protein LOC109842067 [Asparagus officinalis]